MNLPRAFAAGTLVNDDLDLWVTGGFIDKDGTGTKSTELISVDKRSSSPGPDLPVPLAKHCATLIDDSTFITIGGYIKDEGYTGKSFYFYGPTEVWSEAPKLQYVRGYFGCGSFDSDYHGGSRVTIAIGGWDGRDSHYDSSEILVKGSDYWIEGPMLPYNIMEMSTIVKPDLTGLYVVGGYSKSNGDLNNLLELTCPSSGCQWKILKPELQVPRAKHVSFLIYDHTFDCNIPSNSTK